MKKIFFENKIGQYNKISEKFNPELMDIIKILLQVQPENRPNCGK
jgi:hypothetical protein